MACLAWLVFAMMHFAGVFAAPPPRSIETSGPVLNSSQEYFLRLQVKPGQADKQRFDGLYACSFHTGAGLSDVVFYPANENGAIKGYLHPIGSTLANGQTSHNQLFDLNNDFAWAMVVAFYDTFSAAWEPVRMNAGAAQRPSESFGVSGFFIDTEGLQWRNRPSAEDGFGGWVVCDWWHKAPQLFARVARYLDVDALCNCAEVNLIPEYF